MHRDDVQRGVEHYYGLGTSSREGLRLFRRSGGSIRTYDWQQAWADFKDEDEQGIDPERMPEWGERTPRRAPMGLTRDPGRSRFFYWTILDVEEPDGSIRQDQWYGFDSSRDLSDREAVRISVRRWNRMMRRAPHTGSLTGVAIGGMVQAVAPLRMRGEKAA
jgi:hypothetical protein